MARIKGWKLHKHTSYGRQNKLWEKSDEDNLGSSFVKVFGNRKKWSTHTYHNLLGGTFREKSKKFKTKREALKNAIRYMIKN